MDKQERVLRQLFHAKNENGGEKYRFCSCCEGDLDSVRTIDIEKFILEFKRKIKIQGMKL